MVTPLRIAMWSGPRNISTALMRSWANRPDTIVCDEPFYACYLQQTGRLHPGREETLARHHVDWRKVRDDLLGDLPAGKSVFYQKQMAHHLLDDVDRDWLNNLTNCFLIREPREMLTSLIKKVPDAQLRDTGLPQQVEIFRQVRDRTGTIPPVIDSRDVLMHPQKLLAKLCEMVGVEFTNAMLSWPTGLRDTDGAWAPFWYSEVAKTTTFQAYRRKEEELPADFQGMVRDCEELFEVLSPHRITT